MNNGGCTHICENTEGSFTCSCRMGYEFAPRMGDSNITNTGLQCQGIKFNNYIDTETSIKSI